jgi:Tol biopolymer transport system component
VIALEDGSDQLGLVSVADGSLRVLKSGQWRGDTRIFFSPDGRFLGYDLPQGDAGPERDVFVMTVDGAREIPAVVHRGRDIMMGWSLDGKRLLFASDRTGAQSLWSVAFVDGKPQGDPVLIKADIGEAESLGVTRAGALYYGLVPGRPTSSLQIATFDFATGKLLNPRDITQDYLESNSEPNWSPDGKLLAYVSTRGRGWASNALLVIRSAETLQVIRELRPKLRSYNLTGWAPDGQSLLAQGRDSDGRGGAFRIDAQTAAVSSLVLDGIHARLTYPAWSPDGKSLYFSRRLDNDVAFFKREIASGAEKEVIRRPALGAVNLSPDGRYIATGSSEPSTNSRLMLLIPVDGGESRVVMRVPSGVPASELENRRKGQNVSGVVWAPDNRSFLTFKSVEGSNEREMWQVPVDGGAPHKLATTRPLQAFRVQPGGQQIAYAVSDPAPPPTSEIWALENFVTSAIPNK